MYSNSGNAVLDAPRATLAATPALRPVIRRADRIPYVRGALAAGTIRPGATRRLAREPLETDGPATCLI